MDWEILRKNNECLILYLFDIVTRNSLKEKNVSKVVCEDTNKIRAHIPKDKAALQSNLLLKDFLPQYTFNTGFKLVMEDLYRDFSDILYRWILNQRYGHIKMKYHPNERLVYYCLYEKYYVSQYDRTRPDSKKIREELLKMAWIHLVSIAEEEILGYVRRGRARKNPLTLIRLLCSICNRQGQLLLREKADKENPEDDIDDIVSDTKIAQPVDQLIEKDRCAIVEQAMKGLTPREEKVLRMRFGIGEKHEFTFEEIGNYLNLTRERVRQLQCSALNKLKCALQGQENYTDLFW